MTYLRGIGGNNHSNPVGPNGPNGAGPNKPLSQNLGAGFPTKGPQTGPNTDAASFSGGIPASSSQPKLTHSVDFKAISEKPVSHFQNLPEGHPDKLNKTTLGAMTNLF